MMPKLFLYGTLADPAALARCAGRPVNTVPVPAALPGFRRVLLRHTPWPTLRRARGEAVDGVVMRVTKTMFRRLQNYESSRYRTCFVRLTTGAGPVRALAFFGDAPTKVRWIPDDKLMLLRSRSF